MWIDSIIKTDAGRELFESLGIVYKPPMGTVTVNKVKIGDMKKVTVKSYVDYNSKPNKYIEFVNGICLYMNGNIENMVLLLYVLWLTNNQ